MAIMIQVVSLFAFMVFVSGGCGRSWSDRRWVHALPVRPDAEAA
jgi:hypothetical protein